MWRAFWRWACTAVVVLVVGAYVVSMWRVAGVLVEFPDVTGLMDKVGVKLEAIKSSPLKAEPSPFTPTTDDERAIIESDLCRASFVVPMPVFVASSEKR